MEEGRVVKRAKMFGIENVLASDKIYVKFFKYIIMNRRKDLSKMIVNLYEGKL